MYCAPTSSVWKDILYFIMINSALFGVPQITVIGKSHIDSYICPYVDRCGNMASILEVSPGGRRFFNVFSAAPENEVSYVFSSRARLR